MTGPSEAKPTCFVIMPITTPRDMVDIYSGGEDHFRLILDHLFAPAIELANHEVIRPIATGDDNIPARIIQNLETADFVLCDMSTANANVFFELGIRTALNKPACLIKDDQTLTVPFDTAIINYHTYDSSGLKWKMDNEIQRLTDHIKETLSKSDGQNSLWKYFALTAIGAPAQATQEGKINLILEQLASLARRQADREGAGFSAPAHLRVSEFKGKVQNIASQENAQVEVITIGSDHAIVRCSGLSQRATANIFHLASIYDIAVELTGDL